VQHELAHVHEQPRHEAATDDTADADLAHSPSCC
jgi:hypothetical protein